jgi:zinc protease
MMTTANPLRPPATSPRPYHFPSFERRHLANGLTLWLVPLPDRELVNVHLLVDAGAATEDEAHGGVAALTAQLLVTGTRRLDAAAFAEATERLGIEVSSESSWDSARAAFQALPERLEDGLALLTEMLREPRFDEGEFERLRAERLADIMQSRADPGRLADEMFLRHVYAAEAPYRRPSAGTPGTGCDLGRDDVVAFHDKNYRPASAHLIVAGRFDADAVQRAAERLLDDWRGQGPGHRSIRANPAGGRRIVLVDRPGSVQSELRVGQVGIARHDPRYFRALVMSALLGGVFGSRLNLRLREELGDTYGAHASFDARRSAGPFTARAAVQTEVTVPAIRELLGQLDRMRDQAPEDDELREVKDFLIGVFPLRFETTGGVTAAIEPLAVYDLPTDYWQDYRARLDEVMPADTLQVARELIEPDQLLILLTGDASRLRDQLDEASFGPMQVIPAE